MQPKAWHIGILSNCMGNEHSVLAHAHYNCILHVTLPITIFGFRGKFNIRSKNNNTKLIFKNHKNHLDKWKSHDLLAWILSFIVWFDFNENVWTSPLKKIQTQTGDTLVFKTHAPISAHHAIHANCVLIALHLQAASSPAPTEPVSEYGSKSERAYM